MKGEGAELGFLAALREKGGQHNLSAKAMYYVFLQQCSQKWNSSPLTDQYNTKIHPGTVPVKMPDVAAVEILNSAALSHPVSQYVTGEEEAATKFFIS